ncbi:MAG: hypothetical protein GC161_01170 [Planctomycetaceae bacterium]|nr:hypothetical protein [Planctomycetaceae bacterium]
MWLDTAAEAPSGELWSLLALAVLQGLTEFLPVSSSGHLVLGKELFGLRESGGVLVEVALHVGTLGAVLAVYGKDLVALVRDALGGRPRYLMLLLLGSVPAGLLGVLAKDFLEGLFEEPRVAGAGLLVTAGLLLVSDARRRRLEREGAAGGREVGVVDAVVIGVAQALAICPGISRAGSTIAAGLLRGLDAAAAARFSFLLSLPAVGGAALLEARHLDRLPEGQAWPLALAVVLSGVVGFLSLRLLLVALAKGAFRWFALYCAVLGVVALVLLGAAAGPDAAPGP